MRLALIGFDLSEGKIKYQDTRLAELEGKISPKKTHPFFVEFIRDKFESADIIVCLKEKKLDIIVIDLEKLEKRVSVSTDENEKSFLNRCIKYLEEEVLLCDAGLSKEEKDKLNLLQLLTVKPTLVEESQTLDATEILKNGFNKAEIIFFYTIAKGELKSWSIRKQTPIIEAASKIHTDLARGFIKAEVINFDEFINMHNMQEAKAKGKIQLVDRDYIVQDGDIIEIRFSV